MNTIQKFSVKRHGMITGAIQEKMKPFFKCIILIALIYVGLTCHRFFSPDAYFPLKLGYTWYYSGIIHSLTVSEMKRLDNEEQYTITMLDSLENILSKEIYIKRGNRVYWAAFLPSVRTIPNIRFEPVIPISPISNKIGDMLTFIVSERHEDGTTCRARVSCKIEAVEQLEIGIGVYTDCIKMQLLYESLDAESPSPLAGVTTYWYAKNVGIVRFEMPSGEGELVRAKFD